MNELVQALLIGCIYWLGTNRYWYATTTVIRQPLVMAVPIGIVMGDIKTAMIVASTLQLIYLGAIAPGGNIPADEAFASCVAIPIAIKTGISPEVAVSLAVPVGLLGVLLDTVRRTYASAFVRIADNAAAAGNVIGGIGPLVLFGLYMSILAYFLVVQGYTLGRDSIASVLQSSAISKLIDSAAVLGLFMMGALSASYVKLTTAIKITTEGGEFNLQDTFDGMLLKLLPLCVVFLIYFYIKKKGPKYIRIVFGIIAISLILAFLGWV